MSGGKDVSCYAQRDHMWVWSEYCDELLRNDRGSVLEAFKRYTVGKPFSDELKDVANFGTWLLPDADPAPKNMLTEIVNGLTLD